MRCSDSPVNDAASAEVIASEILDSLMVRERNFLQVPDGNPRPSIVKPYLINPAPMRYDIHVGSEDWQSQPAVVTEFGKLTGVAVTVAQGRGHDLGKDYVGPVIDQGLCINDH